MQVKDVMTREALYIPTGSTLRDAAEMMQQLNCGFLPIGDPSEDRLQGVVTDRDIVLRAVAAGKDPGATTVEEVKSDKVLCCFEGDNPAPGTPLLRAGFV